MITYVTVRKREGEEGGGRGSETLKETRPHAASSSFTKTAASIPLSLRERQHASQHVRRTSNITTITVVAAQQAPLMRTGVGVYQCSWCVLGRLCVCEEEETV